MMIAMKSRHDSAIEHQILAMCVFYRNQYGAFQNVNYRPTFSQSLKTVNGMFRSKLTLLTNLVNNDTSVYITPNSLLGPCRRAGLRGFE